MLLAAAINPAFLEMQKSCCIWGETRGRINSCSVIGYCESCQSTIALVCKGYKLGRGVTGSPFSIAFQCWTTSPYYTRGSLVSVHLYFVQAVAHLWSLLHLPASSMQPLSDPQHLCRFTKAQLFILRDVCWVKCRLFWGALC